jgi:hypothetical protein
MGSRTASSFAACIDFCAGTPGCVDVSYVHGSCYMKNVLNIANSVSYVWSAKLVPVDTSPRITCPDNDGTTAAIPTGATTRFFAASTTVAAI